VAYGKVSILVNALGYRLACKTRTIYLNYLLSGWIIPNILYLYLASGLISFFGIVSTRSGLLKNLFSDIIGALSNLRVKGGEVGFISAIGTGGIGTGIFFYSGMSNYLMLRGLIGMSGTRNARAFESYAGCLSIKFANLILRGVGGVGVWAGIIGWGKGACI
jgi:hypothetical protein